MICTCNPHHSIGVISRPNLLNYQPFYSVPAPPPVPHIPTFRGWYFFVYTFGFMRVCGECCGLRRQGLGAVKVKVLSLGADSLIESVPVIWVEVRERFLTNRLKSMGYLRTDRASFYVALGSKRKDLSPKSGHPTSYPSPLDGSQRQSLCGR